MTLPARPSVSTLNRRHMNGVYISFSCVFCTERLVINMCRNFNKHVCLQDKHEGRVPHSTRRKCKYSGSIRMACRYGICFMFCGHSHVVQRVFSSIKSIYLANSKLPVAAEWDNIGNKRGNFCYSYIVVPICTRSFVVPVKWRRAD